MRSIPQFRRLCVALALVTAAALTLVSTASAARRLSATDRADLAAGAAHDVGAVRVHGCTRFGVSGRVSTVNARYAVITVDPTGACVRPIPYSPMLFMRRPNPHSARWSVVQDVGDGGASFNCVDAPVPVRKDLGQLSCAASKGAPGVFFFDGGEQSTRNAQYRKQLIPYLSQFPGEQGLPQTDAIDLDGGPNSHDQGAVYDVTWNIAGWGSSSVTGTGSYYDSTAETYTPITVTLSAPLTCQRFAYYSAIVVTFKDASRNESWTETPYGCTS